MRPLLGTFVEMAAGGDDALAGIDAAFAEIAAIHRLMSFHDGDSDVSRINRADPGQAVQVDARTYEVLAFAQELSIASGGAFDITVGGALVEAGFLPPPNATTKPSGTADFRAVALLENRHVARRADIWIDLGGIAKGYAVDCAVGKLESHGIRHGMVNAGGDLRMFGKPQPVHLRHPVNPGQLLVLGPVENMAIASSGSAFGRGGLDPLVSPRTHACVRWRNGVTVAAPRCMAADALTKIVRLAPRRAPSLLARWGARSIILGQGE